MKLAALFESGDRSALLSFQQALAELDDWGCELQAPTEPNARPHLIATRKDGCQVKVTLANEGYELHLDPYVEIIDYGSPHAAIAHDFAKMHDGAVDEAIKTFRDEFSEEVSEICNEFDGPERRSMLEAAREKRLRQWIESASKQSNGVIGHAYAQELVPAIKDELKNVLWAMY